ncbi:MAG: NIPSNAP family protein [Pseudomonadota bacterium]
MINQLRIYEIPTDNLGPFHDRFRDQAQPIFARHGFRILAMWDSTRDGKTFFIYLLAWRDEAEMKAAWEAFMADEEWAEIKRVTGAKHGTMVNGIEDHVLTPTSYSAAITGEP